MLPPQALAPAGECSAPPAPHYQPVGAPVPDTLRSLPTLLAGACERRGPVDYVLGAGRLLRAKPQEGSGANLTSTNTFPAWVSGQPAHRPARSPAAGARDVARGVLEAPEIPPVPLGRREPGSAGPASTIAASDAAPTECVALYSNEKPTAASRGVTQVRERGSLSLPQPTVPPWPRS